MDGREHKNALNSLWNFISADYETRLARSGKLNDFIDGGMDYFLGPTGIPNKARAANTMMNPIAQMGQAGADATMATDPRYSRDERINAGVNALTGTLATLAPAAFMKAAGRPAADAVMETLINTSRPLAVDGIEDASRAFWRDDSGMFLGPGASGADLPALARAEAMLESGIPREKVLRDTGWFRGVDGKMRWETDDSAAVLRSPLQNLFNNGDEGAAFGGDVNSGLLHQELLGGTRRGEVFPPAYDNLGEGLLNATKRGGDRVDGSYKASTGDIEIGAPNPQEGKAVLLHELQHAIQQNEGFARGSSPANEMSDIAAARNVRKSEIVSQMDRIKSEEGLSGYRPQHPRLVPLQEEYDGLLGRNASDNPAAMDAYRRSSGEVEARNASLRSAMSAERRLETPPWATQDVPDAEQIVRFGSGNALSEVIPARPLTPQQEMAERILEMRAAGNAADVTDEMMAMADDVTMFNKTPLPMDEASRMARAQAAGFTEDGFHGTNTGADFNEFGQSATSRRKESYFAPKDRPDFASSFAASDQGRVLPVRLRSGNFIDGRTTAGNEELMTIIDDANLDFDWRYHRSDGETKRLPDWGEQNVIDAANRSGADGLRLQERPSMTSAAVFDPTAIRSRFARFDPEFAHLGNLSAGVAGLGVVGLGATQGQQTDDPYAQRNTLAEVMRPAFGNALNGYTPPLPRNALQRGF
jgi:hypothetical protein